MWLFKRRPPEIRVPGHSPSQAQKCLTVGHFVISVPISEMSFNAVLASIPGIVVKSDPMSCLRCFETLNEYSYFLGFRRVLRSVPASIGLRASSFFLWHGHIPESAFDKNRKHRLLAAKQIDVLLDSCLEESSQSLLGAVYI